jgi:hypothetical protein
MKKQYLTVLLTLVCICGLALGAYAHDQDAVVAKVPHNFVVGNLVLPAGTYTVSRVSVTTGNSSLKITNHETGASTFLLPSFFGHIATGHEQLSFEHAGDKYFLSGIETATGRYTIKIQPSALALAQAEQQGPSSSGGN